MARAKASATMMPPPMPVDVRLMQTAAQALAVLGAIAIGAALLLWFVRLPVFALRSISVDGEVARNSASTIRANAAPKLAGNFFTMDLQRARAAFEAVPWVRHAVVRRIWPNRLAVTLEEHRAAALWAADDGNDKLVNHHGEIFEANIGDVEDDALPRFTGPEDSALQMLALYRRLQPALQPLDEGDIEQLKLSGRGSWRAELEGGAAIELGRGSDDEVITRAERFVRTLRQVTDHYQRPLQYADLRHPDGYAVRLKGVTTVIPKEPTRKR
ncbi:FtsQ-type POTRA domain-containing protein [Aquincola sp. S2]|uniref:Cell division protein FtsQ n=1 Tax=Pseudaquabacterium terrae TaxID=2732868 RepID=A0ABX2ESV3_9BURK|nr:cell division protein FtsQ/DivIB [Aquabacterium terrae]NRF71514.1 FtsQ-type POTRA domain-containing protein [Aquabacterium terrae]